MRVQCCIEAVPLQENIIYHLRMFRSMRSIINENTTEWYAFRERVVTHYAMRLQYLENSHSEQGLLNDRNRHTY